MVPATAFESAQKMRTRFTFGQSLSVKNMTSGVVPSSAFLSVTLTTSG
jgi:hypothetical protein